MTHQKFFPSILLVSLFAVSLSPAYGEQSSKVDPATKAKVAALIEKLEDKDEKVRNFAAERLGDIGPAAKGAVSALIVALKDKYYMLRSNSAEALGEIGPAKDVVPALIVASSR